MNAFSPYEGVGARREAGDDDHLLLSLRQLLPVYRSARLLDRAPMIQRIVVFNRNANMLRKLKYPVLSSRDDHLTSVRP